MSIEKLYTRLLAGFFIYLFILNITCFATTFNPKSLINPFYIKQRSMSVYLFIKHIVLIEGLAIRSVPEEHYYEFIGKMSKKYSVDSLLIRSVIEAESNFRRFAISRAGAMGLMQVMPVTFNEMGFDNPFIPQQNIEAGTRYLSLQIKRFNDVKLALAAYNSGPRTVIESGNKVPEIAQTKHYVEKIMNRLEELKKQN